MRLALILILFATPALASEPERTAIFCDQYARHAAGTGGVHRGGNSGKAAGAVAGATQGSSTSVNRGALAGGTVGAIKGGQHDKRVYDFFLEECLSGHRLTVPWP